MPLPHKHTVFIFFVNTVGGFCVSGVWQGKDANMLGPGIDGAIVIVDSRGKDIEG